MPPRKGPSDPLNAKKETLAAVLLADSFTQHFRPITVECPKVLLPLVNVRIIDYTLEWLVAGGVEEVYVFASSHAAQVKRYVETSKWGTQKAVDIKVVVGTACRSAGDALRAIDQSGVIGGDFVLVSGDTVSNLPLGQIVAAHRARRETDQNAIMTMVMQSVPSAVQRAWLGAESLLVAMDPDTSRLLAYEPCRPGRRRPQLDAALFGERDSVALRTDLVDCHIAVCSLDVLVAFSDNFDYQNVQRDLVAGVLSEEELGTKLHVHLAQGSYAARVHNLRSYDAVSRDVLQRWAFPFCPDVNWMPQGNQPSAYTMSRQHVYRDADVRIARSAEVGRDCALGSGTTIGEGCTVTESVIGRDCKLGRNCQLQGMYLHDGVTLGDEVHASHALLCQGAVVHDRATILPGAVISFKVVVAEGHTVQAEQRVTLCRQRAGATSTASDDELEYSGSPAEDLAVEPDSQQEQGERPKGPVLAAAASLAARNAPAGSIGFDEHAVGKGGAGFAWLQPAAGPLLSLAFTPQDAEAAEDEGYASSSDSAASTTETVDVAAVDPEAAFKREVAETVLRCAAQGFDPGFAVVELNGLKIAEDKSFADCASAILTTVLGLCFPAPARTKAENAGLYPSSAADTSSQAGRTELLRRVGQQLEAWGQLLGRFLKTEDEQVELLLTLEEFCGGEGSPEAEHSHGAALAPLFAQVLKLLYDKEVVGEEAILAWADEKEQAEASERIFLKRAADFLKWLREAEEEEDSSGDDDEE